MRLPSLYTFYKEHHACYECRKMFRRPVTAELALPHPKGEAMARCPECRRPMHNVGKGFRPPKRSDLKAWKRLQEDGSRFCGWHNRW